MDLRKEIMKRNFEIDVGSIRAETRTVQASLSSEFPVKRFDGEEVLSHKPGAVDLSRAPLPLLRAHDNTSLPVGVVEGLTVADGRLKGTIRLSANQDAIWQDIKDGILRNLSIGYQIQEKQKTKRGFIATRWFPYECSLVAAPADNTVGINRSIEKKEIRTMDKNDLLKAKKQAVEELAELAKTGTDETRMIEVQGEIRSLDSRLEALEVVEKNKPAKSTFIPDVKNRSIIEFSGGPVINPTYARMFNNGSDLEVNEEEIRAFRASMVSGVPASGGLAVAEPMAAKWLDDSLPSEIIRPRATVWPMESATRKVPGWDASSQAGGTLFGGFKMAVIPEEGEGAKQTGKLRTIMLSAIKAGIFVDMSSELLEDGLGMDAQLDRAMRLSIGYGLDNFFINGSGAGEPLGIRNCNSRITVAKEAGQGAKTICWENLCKMFSRMYSPGQNRAIWLCNNNAIPQLLTLSIAVGTGGSYIPVLQAESGSGTFKILGRPVIFTSHMPTLGSADDIMFCDLSQYVIGMRRDIRLEKSNIPGWVNDLLSYRALLRFDGQDSWGSPLSPEHGETLSWAVGLEAR